MTRALNGHNPVEALNAAAVDAERMLLAIAITAPRRMPEILPLVDDEHWLRPDHLQLWQLLKGMANRGEHIDLVSVTGILAIQNLASAVGGLAYVTELPSFLPSSALEIAPLVATMRERHLRVRLRAIGQALLQAASGQSEVVVLGRRIPIQDTREGALALASELQAGLSHGTTAYTLTMDEAIDAGFEARERARTSGQGRVPTGLHGLDTHLGGGLARQEETVVAARPSMGKSALLTSWARVQASDYDCRVAIFSLEMAAELLGNRILASGAMVDLHDLNRGALDGDRTLAAWVDSNRSWLRNMRLYAGPRLTLDQVLAQAYAWHADGGLDVIYIDYLTLVRHRAGAETHSQAVGETTAELKDLAKALNVAVVVLAQLNRKLKESASTKTLKWPGQHQWIQACKDRGLFPQPEHLRDSGEIEQAADVILSPNRAGGMGFNLAGLSTESLAILQSAACIDICKNRNGRVGTVPVQWEGRSTTFWDEPPDPNAPEADLL